MHPILKVLPAVGVEVRIMGKDDRDKGDCCWDKNRGLVVIQTGQPEAPMQRSAKSTKVGLTIKGDLHVLSRKV
jgi:hypothetical protein